MSPIGPLDFEARERIADRERMAAPLRLAAEGRRERLGWQSEPRAGRLGGMARAAEIGGRLVIRAVRVPRAVVRGLIGRHARRPLVHEAPTTATAVPLDPAG
jgi:hypothetical protein